MHSWLDFDWQAYVSWQLHLESTRAYYILYWKPIKIGHYVPEFLDRHVDDIINISAQNKIT